MTVKFRMNEADHYGGQGAGVFPAGAGVILS